MALIDWIANLSVHPHLRDFRFKRCCTIIGTAGAPVVIAVYYIKFRHGICHIFYTVKILDTREKRVICDIFWPKIEYGRCFTHTF